MIDVGQPSCQGVVACRSQRCRAAGVVAAEYSEVSNRVTGPFDVDILTIPDSPDLTETAETRNYVDAETTMLV